MIKGAEKAPAIRFRGFTDDWEQRKLGEMAESFQYGLNAAAKKYDGKNKYIRITDIDDLSHEFSQSNLTSPDTDISQADNYRLNEGNILFARTGASVGKTYIYKHSDGRVYYAGFLIRAKLFKEYDSEFVFQNTLTSKYKRFIQITSQRSGQPGVNAQEYENYGLMVPSLKEQKGIGNLLANLDKLITLHQHKLEQQKKLKKYFLQNMFPEEGETVPRIRFKEFTGDWEQRKLGDCFWSLPNNTLSRAELSYENGVVMNVHYGDVLIKFDEYLDVSKERLPFIEKQSAAEKIKTSYLKNGDVIVADTAEDETVGKCTEIIGLTDQKVTSGLHTIPLRPKEQFATGYLGFYLNSAVYHNQLIPLIQGTKVSSISKGAMQKTVIKYPANLEEQELIGQYFMKFDNLIVLHQRKIDQLQVMKKFMLQNLFV